ncbi:hypothetical protein [Bradyrhizobium sp.]|uniref:hypothetical protein n=1 Tax=Bradyrhizobium sp. TaxID=376 RepID=UPI002D4F4B7F|nr:hypothetical protein [Bradyrhizobium sp.]HZR73040.1 hypothetical protein [Bradyrhizobium sp.]
MTYQDPDPWREPDMNSGHRVGPRGGSGAGSAWAWIAGAVMLVVVLLFIVGQNGTSRDVNNSPAAPQVTAPADNAARAPIAPRQTRGQGG